MMKQYIGTKLISATPAVRINGTIYELDEPMPKVMAPREEGYKVVYPDGYTSWSPKVVFESAYLELDIAENPQTNSPTISQQMVDDFISEVTTFNLGNKTTVVRATLRNGFELVESSSCVCEENYNTKIGEDICLNKIKDKVWYLLGFLLQTAMHGIN